MVKESIVLHPWNDGNCEHLSIVDLAFTVRNVIIQFHLGLGMVVAITVMPYFQIIPQSLEVATGDQQLLVFPQYFRAQAKSVI